MYHRPSDTLYQYVKGALYSHSRKPMLEEELGSFRIHRTRKPLPNNDIIVAVITITPDTITLDGTVDPGEI